MEHVVGHAYDLTDSGSSLHRSREPVPDDARLALTRPRRPGRRDHGWFVKARGLAALGQEEDARRAFDRVLELEPEFASEWYAYGGQLLEQRRYAPARQAFERVLAIEPENAHAWYGRAYALYYLDRRDEARAAAENAASLGSAAAAKRLERLDEG